MSNNSTRPQKPKSSPITSGRATIKPSFRKRSATAPTWDDVPAQMVHALICACASHNAPATLSYTRDGTALVVSVYYQGDRYVDYLSGEHEIDEYFTWIIEELLNLSGEDANYYLQARMSGA